jgi:hypothetical protein
MNSMPTITAVAAFIITLVLFAPANAQIDETGNPRTTRVKIQKIVKVVRVPEVRYQKISGVAITTVQPNAEVSIKAAGGGKYKQNLKTNSDGVLMLENVPPGKYTLTVSLDGYVTEESEIDVAAQRLITVPVNLAPITHDIFIKTNVKNGEVRYARIQKRSGSVPSGVGGYCMTPIENGTAAITRMQEGDYSVEVRPADVEYQPVSREINISDEALAKTETAAGRNEIPIVLTRTTSTEDFLANWLPNEWKLPPGWKVENKRMLAEGPGVALLQNDRYNHYKDFELKTTLRSLDNGSVGFVVRAVDFQNYYLIQLTGSASTQPYMLTGYIVKNGRVAETLAPVSIRAYERTISDRKYFNLTIKATGNVFRVTLEDSETGRPFVIGIIEDQNNTYPIGAIGIGTKDPGRSEVDVFHIKYNLLSDKINKIGASAPSLSIERSNILGFAGYEGVS